MSDQSSRIYLDLLSEQIAELRVKEPSYRASRHQAVVAHVRYNSEG